MMPLADTSTPGFKKKAGELRDAVLATAEGSNEERVRFGDFRDSLMKEAEVSLNSAMQAADAMCGYARGDFKNYSRRPDLLTSSMELLIELADMRLKSAQLNGIGKGDEEIEEPCNRLRNVMFRYPSVDGGACAAKAQDLWLNLIQEWVKQKPVQTKRFADANFSMNSDGAQNAVAEILRARLTSISRESPIATGESFRLAVPLGIQAGSPASKCSPSPI